MTILLQRLGGIFYMGKRGLAVLTNRVAKYIRRFGFGPEESLGLDGL